MARRGNSDMAERLRRLPVEQRRRILAQNGNDAKVARALGLSQGDERAESHTSVSPNRRNERMARLLELAQRHYAYLEASDETLVVFLPGLRLSSINTLLGSDKAHAQARAKREAQQALWEYRGHLHRFPPHALPVEIQIWQVYESEASRCYDADNLYKKPLVDALALLKVIPNDGPDCVRYTGAGNIVAPRSKAGVLVVVEPSDLDQVREVIATARESSRREVA